MRQSLFRVTSWLRSMGDLLGKHLRKRKIFDIRPLRHFALDGFGLPADSHS